ncbi:uncharacterized protein LOC120357871 [Solenopsis invicta]|uniref:uncharacterized protein LOC120357871 n=1 Tax=Solenopsis invicta TaxID=13686 RepID=UPI00193D9054|nr:uncharacterized protein LOC120357871 [Solenopsis invicta]
MLRRNKQFIKLIDIYWHLQSKKSNKRLMNKLLDSIILLCFLSRGQYKAISDPVAEQVRKIIRPSVEGLSNVFDNDCIEGSQNSFDKNVEFVEEWLDYSNKNIIGGESDIEEGEDDKEENIGDTKDDGECNMKEPVLNVCL